MGFHRETVAVLGMYADKDVDGVIDALKDRVDRWHVASLPGPRGAESSALRDKLLAGGVAADAVRAFTDVEGAYAAAAANAGETDRIVVFGSFLTVAAALGAGRPPSP
jgi:dihydrofolate synthase/folylpolyglutamate synthase